MPTDGWLEIVDTAVKVGLGALISGLSTFWVTWIRQKHQVRTSVSSRRIELMERIAMGLESHSAAQRKALASILGRRRIESKLKDELLVGLDNVSNAKAWSDLLGDPRLGKSIGEYFRWGWDFHKRIVNAEDVVEAKDVADVIREMNQLKRDALFMLSQAYGAEDK